MAEVFWFCDTSLGTGSNNGTTMDDAWQSIETAMEYASFNATHANWLLIRRGSSYTCAGNSQDIAPTDDGTAVYPIVFCGFPRNVHSISSSDWTQNSTTVTVDDNDMDREKHCGRWITAPDGNDYLITRVVSTSSILIDRKYQGTTQENQTATIKKDPEYDWINFSSTFTGNVNDNLTVTAHPYITGNSVYVYNSTSADLPDPLANATRYYVIYVDANTIRLATTEANALAGTQIDITDTGTGTHYIQTINDFAWTLKLSNYQGDADTLPLIDFDDYDSQLYFNSTMHYYLRNLSFKDSTDIGGIISCSASLLIIMSGCLIKQNTQNDVCLNCNSMDMYLERVIIEGVGSSQSNNDCLQAQYTICHITNCAFYAAGNHAVDCQQSLIYLDNVNLGVESANYDFDISSYIVSNKIIGKDVKFGASVGYVGFSTSAQKRVAEFSGTVFIENFQKQLGEHRTFYLGMGLKMEALTGATTPNKKLSDIAIKISWPVEVFMHYMPLSGGRANRYEVFCHEFEATTDSRNYKYWIYNNAAGTLNPGNPKTNIYLELEYVSDHNNDTEQYIISKVYSTEQMIANAADATDWDYISVNSIAPATASKVRIKCYCNHYHATGSIFIDPAVVIT